MEKRLLNIRLIFNEDTCNIIHITGTPDNEKHIIIQYTNDLYKQFLGMFSEDQVIGIIKNLKYKNKRLYACKVVKSFYDVSISEANKIVKKLKKSN